LRWPRGLRGNQGSHLVLRATALLDDRPGVPPPFPSALRPTIPALCAANSRAPSSRSSPMPSRPFANSTFSSAPIACTAPHTPRVQELPRRSLRIPAPHRRRPRRPSKFAPNAAASSSPRSAKRISPTHAANSTPSPTRCSAPESRPSGSPPQI